MNSTVARLRILYEAVRDIRLGVKPGHSPEALVSDLPPDIRARLNPYLDGLRKSDRRLYADILQGKILDEICVLER